MFPFFLQVIIPASWIFGIILCLPDFLVKDFCKSFRACVANWPPAHEWMSKAYILLWTVLIAAIPVSVMTVLYSRVIFTLWLKPSQATGNDPSEQVGKGDRRIPTTTTTTTATRTSQICIFNNENHQFCMLGTRPFQFCTFPHFSFFPRREMTCFFILQLCGP